MFDPSILDQLPYLPVTQVGEVMIARHRETLDLVLILNTPRGPVAQMMTDEIGQQLALEVIRETGRRSERTQTVTNNLGQAVQQALEQFQDKESGNETQQGENVSTGDDGSVGSVFGGNGAGSPGQRVNSGLSPCSPRDLGLPGTEGREPS